MSPEHVAIIVAVIAAFGGSGGLVAWSRARAEGKLSAQRLRLDTMDKAVTALEKAMHAQGVQLDKQSKQICAQGQQVKDLVAARQSDTVYIAVLIQHINDGKPPPPPPRP